MKQKFTYLLMTAMLMLASMSTSKAEVTFKPIEGSGWSATSPSSTHKLCDGKLDNNWYQTVEFDSYVVLEASEPTYIKGYQMTTPTNFPYLVERHNDRLPKTYAIYGSNDKTTWEVVYSQVDDNVMEYVDGTTYTFYCNSTKKYKYYSLYITAVDGDSKTEPWCLAEFALIPSKVGFTRVDGPEFGFDGKTGTNWNDMTKSLTLEASEPILLDSYTLTTAEDAPNSAPKSWTIEGSNDQENWTVVEKQEENMAIPAKNYYPVNFVTAGTQNELYKYWRITTTATQGGESFQLAEVALQPAFDANADMAVYEIATAEDMVKFSKYVSLVNADADAIVVADIDLTGVDFPAIGPNNNKPYTGTFDGQGHTVSGYVKTSTGHYTGIFGSVKDATIKNMTVKGELNMQGGHGNSGLVGHSVGNSKFTRLISHLNITLNNASAQCAHTAGIVGSLNGKGEVSYCEYHGTYTHAADNPNSDGAVVGYANEGHIHHNIFAGTINYPVDVTVMKQMAGILGYVNNGSFQGCYGNICIGKTNTAAIVGHVNTGTPKDKVYDNYYLEGSAMSGSTGQNAVATDPTPLADFNSGMVAYKTGLYQTIGVDEFPSTDEARGRVYLNGTLNCDGTLSDDCEYSNTYVGLTQNPHNFVDGACTFCGMPEQDENGYFVISSVATLEWFTAYVAKGNASANAVLAVDLDMTGVDFAMIGSDAAPYSGTFDGQHHVISNLVLNKTQDNVGFFGTLVAGAHVKNLVLDASCSITTTGIHVGMIGHSTGAGDVYLTALGNMANVTTTTGSEAGAAGILGNANAGSSAIIDRCWSTGKISGNQTSSISSWQGGNLGKITNCWSIAELEKPQSDERSFYRCGGNPIHTNCWSSHGTQVGNIPADIDIASGALCYLINSEAEAPVWYQRIGVDAMPLPYAVDGGIVYKDVTCYGAVLYSNVEPLEHVRDAEGICQSCGAPMQDENGNYLINCKRALIWFAEHVNERGYTSANALVTANIDLEGEYVTIGSYENNYVGTFDGQDYTISGYSANVDDTYVGLFGYVKDATISNIILKGDINVYKNYVGMVARANGGTYTRLQSYLNINVTTNRDYIGGVFGSVENGSAVSYCAYYGTMNIADVCDGYYGGVVAYAKKATIDHCVYGGTINGGDTRTGGILGYVNNKDFKADSNVAHGNVSNSSAIIGEVGKSTKVANITNNYWLEGSAPKAFDGVNALDVEATVMADFVSGKVAYLTSLYQEVGVENYPCVDPACGIVYEDSYTADTYTNFVVLESTWTEGTLGNIVGTFTCSQPVEGITDDAIVFIMSKEEYEAKGIYNGKHDFGAVANHDKIVVNEDGTLQIEFTCFSGSTVVSEDTEYVVIFHKNSLIVDGEVYSKHVTTKYEAGSELSIIMYAALTGNVTGIEGVEAVANQKIYNLNGVQVKNTQKGQIYIINGKKVLVK